MLPVEDVSDEDEPVADGEEDDKLSVGEGGVVE